MPFAFCGLLPLLLGYQAAAAAFVETNGKGKRQTKFEIKEQPIKPIINTQALNEWQHIVNCIAI